MKEVTLVSFCFIVPMFAKDYVFVQRLGEALDLMKH